MTEFFSEPQIAAAIGAVGGVMLGLAARLGRFCTLGAIEDMLYGGSDIRLRMWGLAIAVAMIGSFALMGSGLLTASDTIYLGLAFQPLAAIVGGLTFGYGMALAGNCGFGAIARLGGGDLRSFVIVLVMGVSAYLVINGPIAPLRAKVFNVAPASGPVPPGLAHHASALTGLPAAGIGIATGFVLLVVMLSSRAFRGDLRAVFWGAVVGLAVVSGWAGMQWLHNVGFEDLAVVSHTFSAPVGETLHYAMMGSAKPLSFGIGSVAGVWVGAFAGSLIKGHFRWEACEDPRELRRQIFGAGLMGVGAVIALGCTVGQGLSAISLLALSAPVTMLAIFAGAAFGLRQLIEGLGPAE